MTIYRISLDWQPARRCSGVHVDLYALACRVAAAGGFLWEILSLQRRSSCRANGLLWLVIIALFGSFVSLYYYLIVLKFVFVEKSREPGASLAPFQFVTNATIAVLAAVILLFGLLPQTLAARILNSLP